MRVERASSAFTLDPPDALRDEAGHPHLDEDYLILSTIHSAKGQEWDVVYVLNAVDGCIPSDMATGTPEEIEEERRLLYVAMTRARDHLHILQPHRFYTRARPNGDRHVYAPRTRFITEAVLQLFERAGQRNESLLARSKGHRPRASMSNRNFAKCGHSAGPPIARGNEVRLRLA